MTVNYVQDKGGIIHLFNMGIVNRNPQLRERGGEKGRQKNNWRGEDTEQYLL
jgi:hypothetical protein